MPRSYSILLTLANASNSVNKKRTHENQVTEEYHVSRLHRIFWAGFRAGKRGLPFDGTWEDICPYTIAESYFDLSWKASEWLSGWSAGFKYSDDYAQMVDEGGWSPSPQEERELRKSGWSEEQDRRLVEAWKQRRGSGTRSRFG